MQVRTVHAFIHEMRGSTSKIQWNHTWDLNLLCNGFADYFVGDIVKFVIEGSKLYVESTVTTSLTMNLLLASDKSSEVNVNSAQGHQVSFSHPLD